MEVKFDCIDGEKVHGLFLQNRGYAPGTEPRNTNP
jgi:hypothetical protein